MWLFIGAWGALVLGIVAWRQWRGKPVSWLRLGLSTLSGLLLGLAFPSITPLPFLMFVGWIPLLWLADDVQAVLAPCIAHRLVPVGDARRGAIEQVQALLEATPLP